MPHTIVSFNNMRHPEKVCISYSLECKLGVYDLAERRRVWGLPSGDVYRMRFRVRLSSGEE